MWQSAEVLEEGGNPGAHVEGWGPTGAWLSSPGLSSHQAPPLGAPSGQCQRSCFLHKLRTHSHQQLSMWACAEKPLCSHPALGLVEWSPCHTWNLRVTSLLAPPSAQVPPREPHPALSWSYFCPCPLSFSRCIVPKGRDWGAVIQLHPWWLSWSLLGHCQGIKIPLEWVSEWVNAFLLCKPSMIFRFIYH